MNRPARPSSASRFGGAEIGSTLTELLVVIGIVGILISLLAPSMMVVVHLVRFMSCQADLHRLPVANELYGGDNDYRKPAIYPLNVQDRVLPNLKCDGRRPGEGLLLELAPNGICWRAE